MAARMRVLVVEDDASMRRAIGRLLDAAGYEHEGFASAEALIASHAASEAPCLVTDIHLPGMSGFELVATMRRQRRLMPAVFITAFDTAALRDASRMMKAAYLVKPFEGHDLIAAVQRLVDLGEG